MTSACPNDARPPVPPRLTVVPPAGGVDPARLAALEDEITTLAGHLAAGEARFLRLLAEFHAAGGWQAHGLRSCAQWLAWKCGMSTTTAREHVRVAEALTALPVLREAFEAGRLSFSKVRAVTRAATPETEAQLVETAQACTASQLDRLCSGIKRVRGNEEALTHRAQARFTANWREDGMLAFSGRLAPEDGAALLAALAALKADPVRREAGDTPVVSDAAGVPVVSDAAGVPVVSDAAGVPVVSDAAGVPVVSDAASAPARSARDDIRARREAEDGLPEDPYRDAAMFAARADAQALVLMARHVLDSPPDAVLSEPVRLIIHAEPSSRSAPAEVAADQTGAENAPAEAAADQIGAENAPAEAAADQIGAENAPAEAAVPRAGSAPAEVAADQIGAENAPADAAETPIGRRAELPPLAGVLDAGPAIPPLPLSPDTLERLACGAIVEVASDPDSAVPATTENRFANRRQRRALLRRDGGCRFAGCGRRRGLHAHHVVHYSRGGPTTMVNLILLCDHHHLLVHEGGWRLEPAGTGWVAVGPDGRRHVDAPEVVGDADRLPSTHQAQVGAETIVGSWAGDPLNLVYAVGVFVERPAEPPASAWSQAEPPASQ